MCNPLKGSRCSPQGPRSESFELFGSRADSGVKTCHTKKNKNPPQCWITLHSSIGIYAPLRAFATYMELAPKGSIWLNNSLGCWLPGFIALSEAGLPASHLGETSIASCASDWSFISISLCPEPWAGRGPRLLVVGCAGPEAMLMQPLAWYSRAYSTNILI